MVEYLVQNWQHAYDQTYLLFQEIRKTKFNPEVIVGIARGGWIPARLMSDFFGLKSTANIKVEAYHVIGEMDVETKITQDLNAPIKGKSILLVDDIADSGTSIRMVIDTLKERGAVEIKSATLFYKKKSAVIPDFYIQETDKWVVFPWEIFETIQELTETWKLDGLSISSILIQLKHIGLPSGMVDSFFVNYQTS